MLMISPYLEHEQLEWPNTAPHDRLRHRLIQHLNGRLPTFVACLFAQLPSLPSQQNRRVSLRDEEEQQQPVDAGPHHKNVEAPSPIQIARDEIAHDWSKQWSAERRSGVYHHRHAQLLLRECITNSAASNAQKRRARKTIEEARDQHRGQIVRECARNQPDKVHPERAKVDRSPSVELRQRAQEHRPKSQPAHENAESDRSSKTRDPEFSLDTAVCARVQS